ncbi:MAG: tRNA (5-methylaminomethyl-2-thiouridine)(34)-methyltransferase MnmD [Flavobacteriales bacterium]|nr:tRNA (5-methylaminomethyl-2-thiouridine)(34)-methyltransferase MnmD [Flavobacteriales bacterium]
METTIPPADPGPLRTADGSLTLRSAQWGEHYHSMHGAVQESTHVFIKAGAEAVQKQELDVLEVGLGTGLNLLLTWVRCLEGKWTVRYTALEPFPLSKEQLDELGHCDELAWPGLHEPFLASMTATPGEWQQPMGGLAFRRLDTPVQELDEAERYDVVYFDAFSPGAQPEMWTTAVFQLMYRALRTGGVLVTYCAKGDVRRAMQAAGFKVERLPGPPGKREMLRATKVPQ